MFTFFRDAGVLSFHTEVFSFHLGVFPSHWEWGHAFEEYDHILEYWGLGPLFLLVRPRC